MRVQTKFSLLDAHAFPIVIHCSKTNMLTFRGGRGGGRVREVDMLSVYWDWLLRIQHTNSSISYQDVIACSITSFIEFLMHLLRPNNSIYEILQSENVHPNTFNRSSESAIAEDRRLIYNEAKTSGRNTSRGIATTSETSVTQHAAAVMSYGTWSTSCIRDNQAIYRCSHNTSSQSLLAK